VLHENSVSIIRCKYRQYVFSNRIFGARFYMETFNYNVVRLLNFATSKKLLDENPLFSH
jgi:hypothetical protein